MIVLIGLIVLVAAVIVGVTGVLANGGPTHELTNNFAVLGYHVTGSTGAVLLYGIVIGAVGLGGLGLLLAGHRRTARRGNTARRDLKQSQRDTTALARDRDEHAGGSRHIRTTPSWRDRLERGARRRPTRTPPAQQI